jgi:hypothetical protein
LSPSTPIRVERLRVNLEYDSAMLGRRPRPPDRVSPYLHLNGRPVDGSDEPRVEGLRGFLARPSRGGGQLIQNVDAKCGPGSGVAHDHQESLGPAYGDIEQVRIAMNPAG